MANHTNQTEGGLLSFSPAQSLQGALFWVTEQIRDGFAQSKESLQSILTATLDDAAQLKHIGLARQQLHKSVAPVYFIDVPGAVQLCQLLEAVLLSLEEGKLAISNDCVAVILDAQRAVLEYLEDIQSGGSVVPVRLFAQYHGLQSLLGVIGSRPADLFFADVSDYVTETGNQFNTDVEKLNIIRLEYEQHLLGFLKSDQPEQLAPKLKQSAANILQLFQDKQPQGFFLAATALFEAAELKKLAIDKNLKSLAGAINIQVRRIQEGQGIPGKLLKEMLFQLSQAERNQLDADSYLNRALQIFKLPKINPKDFSRPYYGVVDLKQLAEASESLMRAKQCWNRVISGELAQIADMVTQTANLHMVVAKLKRGMLANLCFQLELLAKQIAQTNRAPEETVGMEAALALLFIEQALQNFIRLDDSFDVRAEQITIRLATLLKNEPLQATEAWMDDISRDAMQKSTLQSVIDELRTNLRVSEKTLDEFFRRPEDNSRLSEALEKLGQMSGVFIALGYDNAFAAVESCKQTLSLFLDSKTAPDESHRAEHFNRLASILGALDVYIEVLPYLPDLVKKQYEFDAATGEFKLLKQEQVLDLRDAAPAAQPIVQAAPEAAKAISPAVEPVEQSHQVEPPVPTSGAPVQIVINQADVDPELLEIFLMEAEEVLETVNSHLGLSEGHPDNVEYLTTLRRAFHTLKGSGRMVGLKEFGEAAWSIEQTLNLWLANGTPGTSDLFKLLHYVSAEFSAWVGELSQNGFSARMPEGIIASSERVRHGGDFQVMVVEAAPVADIPVEPVLAEPSIEAALPVLEDIAEPIAEEAVEAIAEPIMDEALPAIIDPVAEHIESDLAFEETVDSDDLPVLEVIELAALPEAVPEDQSNELDLESVPELPVVALSEAIDDTTMAELLVVDELPNEVVEDVVQELPVLIEPVPEAEPEIIAAAMPVLTPREAESVQPEERVKQIGELKISLPLYNIFLNEADELIRFIATDFSEWRHEPSRLARHETLRAMHSLGGASELVGLSCVSRIAERLEKLIQSFHSQESDLGATAEHPQIELDADHFDILDNAVERMNGMLHQFAAGQMADPDDVVEQSITDLHHALQEAVQQAQQAAQAAAIEAIPVADEMPEPVVEVEAAPIAYAELPDYADEAVAPVVAEELVADEPAQIDEPIAMLDSELLPEAESIEPELVAELPPELPVVEVAEVVADEPALEASVAELLSESEALPEPVVAAAPLVSIPVIKEAITVDDADEYSDEAVDAELLAIFLEEGHENMPKIAGHLAAWQESVKNQTAQPDLNPLLRLLHTVKGSARMAGAMQLGEVLHDLETRVESAMRLSPIPSAVLEDLFATADESMYLFDLLENPNAQRPVPLSMAMDDQVEVTPVTSEEQETTHTEQALVEPAKPADVGMTKDGIMPSEWVRTDVDKELAAAPRQVVRIQSHVLDRLVNNAGEVNIARARLDNELTVLRAAVSDLTQNVSRLRTQLRDIDIQAETQMQSRMALTKDTEKAFDPLEFDRFTRFQELTRMMAESVGDVATVQQNISRALDSAQDELILQSRLTRDLQQNLMRARMVAFGSITERLYRVVRQASKELGKRVALDIVGAHLDIDRGVLERMVAPFEHLLRNSIVHGIESREARLANGKSDVAELRMEIRQEGNEIIIVVADDGAGLDLDKIRSRAIDRKLISADAHLSENEIANLIFTPGFSTADEVTQLAGRGVGMDVVQTETAELGGRVVVDSVLGQGSRFTIYLPLTTAITQVLMVRIGSRVHAIPSSIIEQVQQVKMPELTRMYDQGKVRFADEDVHFFYFGNMLEDTESAPLAQKYSPVVIAKSGVERVALHVDEIHGNREVVVKNIGPQLARMVGISGATISASGEVILIFNPVQLVGKALEFKSKGQSQQLPQADGTVVVEDKQPGHADGGQAKAEAALSSLPTVMVVDDSLTVRKVSQRLLQREGYQVLLAKDGVDALEQLQGVTPDVMLLDIEMPRMDGFDLTRNIRADERLRKLPIIMITSRTADKHRNYAMELGVNEYMGKPYQDQQLLGKVAQYMGSKAPKHSLS